MNILSDIVSDAPTLTVEALPDDAPDWARVLYRQQVQILETMSTTAALIERGVGEVAPLVDSLSASPLFKMMGGKR